MGLSVNDTHEGQFGENRKPMGRPVGSTNKLTKTVKAYLSEAFNHLQEVEDENGVKSFSLVEWGKRETTEFYKMAAKLIPTEIEMRSKVVITVGITEEEEEDEG